MFTLECCRSIPHGQDVNLCKDEKLASQQFISDSFLIGVALCSSICTVHMGQQLVHAQQEAIAMCAICEVYSDLPQLLL